MKSTRGSNRWKLEGFTLPIELLLAVDGGAYLAKSAGIDPPRMWTGSRGPGEVRDSTLDSELVGV